MQAHSSMFSWDYEDVVGTIPKIFKNYIYIRDDSLLIKLPHRIMNPMLKYSEIKMEKNVR